MAKAQATGALAVTANDLRTGAVVFRRPDGRWSEEVMGADIVLTQEAADALLASARADHDACLVVEPVLVEITMTGNRPSPTRLRERIRAEGPTVPYGEAAKH
jgi:hypothetical protein